jgi:cytochrome b subunit of formate dehydrogenase
MTDTPASRPEESDDAARALAAGNMRMLGSILAISGIVLAAFAVASIVGLMPLSKPASRAAAIVFAATAAVELIIAFYFRRRYKA